MKMLLVDDLSIVRIIQRFFRKLFPDLIFYFQDQSVFYGPVAVNIIRSYTGLSAVQEFPKNNPFCSQLQVRCFFYNAGAFSSKLQSDRSEKLCGFCHDLFSHMLASGKKDIIKMFI